MSYVGMTNARCLFWFIRRLKTIEIMKGQKKNLRALAAYSSICWIFVIQVFIFT